MMMMMMVMRRYGLGVIVSVWRAGRGGIRCRIGRAREEGGGVVRPGTDIWSVSRLGWLRLTSRTIRRRYQTVARP
jgi:hypothetical protein